MRIPLTTLSGSFGFAAPWWTRWTRAILAVLATGATFASAPAVSHAGWGGDEAPAREQSADPLRAGRVHPDLGPDGTPPEPVMGGTATVQINVMPASLCFPIENSQHALQILREVQMTLMWQLGATGTFVPGVADSRRVEDALVLTSGERIFGVIEDLGDTYRVRDVSTPGEKASIPPVPKERVREIQRGVRYTFLLFPHLWHPHGDVVDQRVDARDIEFSFSIYANEHVRCDERRYQFEGITCEANEGWVRFTYPEAYFRADQAVRGMTILPSHVYDLSDPDNPDYDPEASAEEQGRYINEHPNNRMWIGCGPYRVVRFTDEYVEAERFDGYLDRNGLGSGYLDRIRWRRIADATGFQALLEGELDFSSTISSEDYFGRAAEASFGERFYRGVYPQRVYGAVCWNMHRPQLKDVRVRRAIAHAFDFEAFRLSQYKGLATQVTGPLSIHSRAYDTSVQPLELDRTKAEELLDDAGWYDRDGDGVRDKDGRALEIEFLSPAGSASSRTLGLKLQEDLRRIGIRLELRELEFAAWRERQKKREFDATPMGWYPPPEPDPAQLWHSSGGAPGVESSNHSGMQDAEVDRLIGLIHSEPDAERRYEHWHALHARLYELQPFLFLYNVPSRFVINRKLFGFDPGYPALDVRNWYYAE